MTKRYAARVRVPLAVLLMVLCLDGWATNRALEANYEAAVVAQLERGEALSLDAGGQTFLALYSQERTSYFKGVVILLHEQGGHPDLEGVTSHLRTELTGRGWKTLSLQMPVFADHVGRWEHVRLIPDAAVRITAGLEYLKQQGITSVVLVGHGLGAKMGLNYLAKGAPVEVRGLVLLGLQGQEEAVEDTSLKDFETIKLPTLDLYGSRENEDVLDAVANRREVAKKAGNLGYRQDRMIGADHHFTGLEGSLTAKIHGWLSKVIAEREAAVPAVDLK